MKSRMQSIRNSSTLRSEEHTSELQSQSNLVCRLLLEKIDDYAAAYALVIYSYLIPKLDPTLKRAVYQALVAAAHTPLQYALVAVLLISLALRIEAIVN